MEFGSRQEVYSWSERTGFRGRQAVVIRYGGCAHRFVLDCRGGAVNLFYEGLAA